MLIPWAVVYQQFGFVGFLLGAIFLILLGVGMAYEWRKGDLEWARPKIEEPILTNSIPPSEAEKELTQTE
jgi:NADH-quinone oxidoreductase subunit A